MTHIYSDPVECLFGQNVMMSGSSNDEIVRFRGPKELGYKTVEVPLWVIKAVIMEVQPVMPSICPKIPRKSPKSRLEFYMALYIGMIEHRGGILESAQRMIDQDRFMYDR